MSAYDDDPRVQWRRGGEGWPPDVAAMIPNQECIDDSLLVCTPKEGGYVVSIAVGHDDYPCTCERFATLDEALDSVLGEPTC